MSDIRFNQWLHNSGTGGVSQVDGGHVGIGTTNPLIPVGAGVTAVLNVGVVTANYYYGDGSNLSGIVGGGTSLSFNDNIGAYFGNTQDLKIHHDGNHSYIDDQGTGNLRLRSGTLEILNLAGNKTSAIFSSGGGQTLNFNNNTKFVTTNTGVVVTGILTATSDISISNDTGKIKLGASQDLQIYHDGSSNRIIAANAGFILQSQDYTIRSENGSTTYATIDSSGQFALGRNNQITGNGNSSTSVFEQLSNSNYPLALHSSQTNKRGLMIFYATTGAGNAGDPFIVCTDNTNNKFQVTSDGTITNRGHILPATNNTQDLGSTAKGWRNVYMNDLNLSNMNGDTNDVDGTQGSWTIQEGKDDLYIINRLNGKKFKIKLEEII